MEQNPRVLNENADAFTRLASAMDSKLGQLIPVELLNDRRTNISEKVLAI